MFNFKWYLKISIRVGVVGFILHGDEQAQTDQGIERAVGA